MADNLYYKLWYRLDGQDRYIIWITNGKDRFYQNGSYIPALTSFSALEEYAGEQRITLVEHRPLLHDLDAVKFWLASPSADICCQDVLMAWNLFVDVATTFPTRTECFASLDEKCSAIYTKIFHGNNLPAVTPPGEKYAPSWREDEVADLAEFLQAGFELFRNCVRNL